MKIDAPAFLRRSMSVAGVGVLAVVLTACTGRGGGYLPPQSPVFTGPASFGFDFSCERSSKSTSLHPPAGQLRIELAYTDHGTSLLLGSPFSIHGIVDQIDPVLESAICIGQEPPPGMNELIFLGRYRLLSSPPTGFPTTCPTRETRTSPLCRFEVIVRDNDLNRAPSPGDYFQIRLSSATAFTSQLDPATVFYTRAGLLQGGNLTVD